MAGPKSRSLWVVGWAWSPTTSRKVLSVEARKQFRRVNGHLHLRALRAALYTHTGINTEPIDLNKEDAA